MGTTRRALGAALLLVTAAAVALPQKAAQPALTGVTTNSTNATGARQVAEKVAPILVAVVTAPSHSEARKAIQETWGSYTRPGSPLYNPRVAEAMAVRFFIGELSSADASLEPSISSERDVVRLECFVEAYSNLSAKTLGVVTWAYDHGYSHVLKVDDDVFLQPELLLEFFHTQSSPSRLYAGEFTIGAEVNNKPGSKWYMRDLYNHDTYPSYAFGSCYFLGSDIVKHIAERRSSLPLYRVEDAGVAIWLQETAFASLATADLENMYFQAECFDPFAIFTTPVNANEMRLLERNKAKGNMCGDLGHPVVLEECVTRRCHCYPLPEDGQACEQDMANDEYKDLIPRLVQVESTSSPPSSSSS